ncbi:MAG: DNA repair protein RecN, partial [Gemmatimonadaceae bacterium]|nr:DNA repair protein RecN [Gemmatimonadaceae bacterium]
IVTGARARAELDLVDGGALDLKAIAEARAVADGALSEAAAELTRRRASGAKQLAAAVTALLPELGMPDGQFDVTLTPLETIGAGGAEGVQFLAALNAGGEMRPLARIASGGELARILLALSTVLARLQRVPTLVFDEVDAGIGGAVAWQVGALMRRVAAHHQVLAISHLAQIAARAHHHVVVRKGAIGTVTTADTTVVQDETRVLEIARMLGGDADREVSRAHARELLTRGAAVEAAPPARRAVGQRRGKPV